MVKVKKKSTRRRDNGDQQEQLVATAAANANEKENFEARKFGSPAVKRRKGTEQEDGETAGVTHTEKEGKKRRKKETGHDGGGTTTEAAKQADEENDNEARGHVRERDEGGKKKLKTKKKKSGKVAEGPGDDEKAGDDKAFGSDKATVTKRLKCKKKPSEPRKLDHEHPHKIFVNGLPWDLQQKDVKKEFSQYGEIERLDMPLNAMNLPSGTAFIYYASDEGAEKALGRNGTMLGKRTIKVMRAVRQAGKKQEEEETKRRERELTIFVGGLPLDVDAAALRKDFEECGEVMAVRLPKSQDGDYKGQAFIVFRDEKGVKNALQFDGDDYGGRKIQVRLPKLHAPSAKHKGRERGKGKGKGKNEGINQGRRQRICHAFTEGRCCFGSNCRYIHSEE